MSYYVSSMDRSRLYTPDESETHVVRKNYFAILFCVLSSVFLSLIVIISMYTTYTFSDVNNNNDINKSFNRNR